MAVDRTDMIMYVLVPMADGTYKELSRHVPMLFYNEMRIRTLEALLAEADKLYTEQRQVWLTVQALGGKQEANDKWPSDWLLRTDFASYQK